MKNSAATGKPTNTKKDIAHMHTLPTGRKVRKWFLANMFRQFADMAELTPFMKKLRKKTDIIRDVPYRPAGGKANLLDIYRPKNRPGPLPVLIYLHGGGFTLCSKETHRGVALLFARFGFLVCNINYRLAPKYRYPAALEDACHAYRWVTDNAASYGGDSGNLSLAGESAGANLALGLTIAACCRRPEPFAGLVRATGVRPRSSQIIAGLLQVSNPKRFSRVRRAKSGLMNDMSEDILRDVAKAYLGKTYKKHEPENALSDPLVVLETAGKPDDPLPPIFAAVGTADILYDDTKRLENALRSGNHPAAVHYYPDEPHVFHFMHWKKNTRRFWMDCKGFLDHYVLKV
jgi:acetyl esterase